MEKNTIPLSPSAGMESPAKPSSQQGDVDENKINAVKRLMDETETTPMKATALLDLHDSTSDPEPDQNGDESSDEDDPWLDGGAEQVPFLIPLSAQGEESACLAEVSPGYAAYNPGPTAPMQCDADVQMGVARTASVGNPFGCLLSPFRALARIPRKVRKPDPEKQPRGLDPLVIPAPRLPNRFELYLKKALFEETVNVSTTVDEPKWSNDPEELPQSSVFPGWNDAAEDFKLKPQGKFVAETKEALDAFLQQAQLGLDLSILGNGGGFSSTGLPALLKKSFSTYDWLSMWRSSEGRMIRVSRSALGGRPATPSKSEKIREELSQQEQEQLLSLENELLGLDKYMGGDSEYLTVVTYSDEYVGSIALFQAKRSLDHKITSLDRIAMISDVPRKICDVLQDEIKPNRYVVGRTRRKVKCFDTGEMAPPQIIKVSNQATPWSRSGGGWRQALRVPEQSTEYSSGEGLIATIPQMVGLLHLQHHTLTKLASSQAFVFEKPIDASGGLLRRGVLLKGRPEGVSHIGQNTRIAVLFPMDSVWAREQFFWA